MPDLRNHRKLPTRDLIDACLAKDPIAWCEFISRFSKLAVLAFKKRLRTHCLNFSDEDLADLKQNLFLKLWQGTSLESVRGSNNIDAWVVLISANFATDYARKQRSDILNNRVSLFDPTYDNVLSENNALQVQDSIKSDISDPRSSLERKERMEELEKALSNLKPREEIALKLYFYHSMKCEDISKILDIPIGTVTPLIMRAKEKIKKEMQ